MECQKVLADIRQHGGRMRRLLNSKGKEDKVQIKEDRKLERGVDGVQEESTGCK